ncbi:MAG TPA: LysE family transporter [Bryobacteraceae bacterium]
MKAAWTGFLLSISLCLDLGLVNVAILRVSLERGGAAGFLLGAGSSVGDLVYFAVALFGAAAVLRWTPVRWILWILGTAVLLVLAWRMAREAIRPRKIDASGVALSGKRGALALLATGTGLALASPSAILWFAAVGGSVIATFGGDRHSLAGFAAGFFAGGLVWSVVFAFGAAQLRRILGQNLVRALSILAALLFIYFAAVVFIRGAREML